MNGFILAASVGVSAHRENAGSALQCNYPRVQGELNMTTTQLSAWQDRALLGARLALELEDLDSNPSDRRYRAQISDILGLV